MYYNNTLRQWNNCLPYNLHCVAESVSAHFQTDKTLILPALLGVCASLVHNKVRVKTCDPYTGGSFLESLSLFTLGIADSSERKSPIMKWLQKPVHEYLDETNKANAKLRQEAEALRKTFEVKLRKLRKRAASLNSDSIRFKEAHREILELERKIAQSLPVASRLYLQDTTAAAAAIFMQEQIGNGMYIADAEGTSFDAIFKEHILMEMLLSGFSCERISFERSSRPSIDIASPHAGICILSQMPKLEKLVKKAHMWDEGFIPRCLIFLAQPQAGFRSEAIGHPVHPETERWWQKHVKDMLELPFKEDGTDHILELSHDAAKYWSQTVVNFNQRIAQYEFPKELVPWVGKASGIMTRLAAIFHCVESANPLVEEIPIERMYESHNLIEAVIPHMRDVHAIFAMHNDPVHAAIIKIINWLHNENGTIEFFACRDMYRTLGIKTEVAHEACRQLQRDGLLYLDNINQPIVPKQGRHGTPVYFVEYRKLHPLTTY